MNKEGEAINAQLKTNVYIKQRFKPNPNNLKEKEIKNIAFKHEKKSFTKISKEELSSLREINI